MRAVIREIIETIILSLLLFVGIQFAVQTYQVEGASMRPTLSQGQYLLVNKLVYRHLSVGSEAESAVKDGAFTQNGRIYPFHPPQHGEVVIFNFPNDPSRDFVKRVIGMPGDTVEIRGGHTFVNGDQLDESYASLDDYDEMDAFKVPTDFVFRDGRQPPAQQRLPRLGHRAAGKHRRQGLGALLATPPDTPLPNRTRLQRLNRNRRGRPVAINLETPP